jgi:hypothetical protein
VLQENNTKEAIIPVSIFFIHKILKLKNGKAFYQTGKFAFSREDKYKVITIQ